MNAEGLKILREHELKWNLAGCWRELRAIEDVTPVDASVMDNPKYVAILNMAVAYRHALDRRFPR